MNVRYVADIKGRVTAAVVPLSKYRVLLRGKLDAAKATDLRDELRTARRASKRKARAERARD